MKYRYVGDIHGQIDVMLKALDCDADRIIFCGDFLDSWRRSVDEQIQCLRLALDVIGDRVSVVFGNHEMSYLFPQKMACSGWNGATQAHMIHLKEDVLKKFKPYVYEQGVLVTHAGLSLRLWKEYGITLENLEDTLNIWWNDHNSPFFQVGPARGGTAACGGPLWCDVREFQSIDELPQIFGHSRGSDFRFIGNSVCIDVLENTAPKFLDREYDV